MTECGFLIFYLLPMTGRDTDRKSDSKRAMIADEARSLACSITIMKFQGA